MAAYEEFFNSQKGGICVDESQERIISFIENENAFAVMAELKRQGLLQRADISHAMTLDRAGWLRFMKEKAGIPVDDDLI